MHASVIMQENHASNPGVHGHATVWLLDLSVHNGVCAVAQPHSNTRFAAGAPTWPPDFRSQSATSAPTWRRAANRCQRCRRRSISGGWPLA